VSIDGHDDDEGGPIVHLRVPKGHPSENQLKGSTML
jgi:hypothetical protein